ncbi:MAG: SDR family oxidoreductase [Acidobacteriota bacterium]|nr:SDR family oxidoreductase [Acidobacteriota bacterium]
MPDLHSEHRITATIGTDNFALITGASGGIGACFARALAARGRNLALVARSRDKLEALKTEIAAKYSLRIEIIEQDLSVEGAAARLAASLKERGIGVDLLVNNAGFGSNGEFWKLPLDREASMLRLNIVTLTELTHVLMPAMIERRNGGVINISSTASFQPIPYTAVYAATKAYVTSFSMALAEEVSGYGVKVMALCPGGTATNFFAAGEFDNVNLPGGLQSPEDVVETGLRAFDRGRSLAVTRFLNRLMVFVQRLAPRRLVAQQAGDMFRPKNLHAGK